MDEESYREFQNELIVTPDAGRIIQGSGGIESSIGAVVVEVSVEVHG